MLRDEEIRELDEDLEADLLRTENTILGYNRGYEVDWPETRPPPPSVPTGVAAGPLFQPTLSHKSPSLTPPEAPSAPAVTQIDPARKFPSVSMPRIPNAVSPSTKSEHQKLHSTHEEAV